MVHTYRNVFIRLTKVETAQTQCRLKYPGPNLAAVTHWYEAYYDLVAEGGGGQFTWQVKGMHEKYRPILRIIPEEMHIDDPDFWNEIYCSSTPSKPMDKLVSRYVQYRVDFLVAAKLRS
ncbi:hypothetical protein LX32DRAFT_648232 [Colletotrichum zoysiae]|uniref:Uncharacterized protein n=1 Tax=Colletotrichum zoysiae TaxID=1216348 RepID=A0AAD9M533_9PEZI|nr:hypothetical protein LX32DRAFT_648232 [Colletotrichum zoysiae]